MTEEQIKHMVDRFLNWKLPADFNPDCGIHFDAEEAIKRYPENHRFEPVGTNLLTATQAKEMVRHMIEAMPSEATAALNSLKTTAEGDVVERVARAIWAVEMRTEPTNTAWDTCPEALKDPRRVKARAALAAMPDVER